MGFMDLFSCFQTKARRNRIRSREMNQYIHRLKLTDENNKRSLISNLTPLHKRYLADDELAQPKRIGSTPVSTPIVNRDTSNFVLNDNVYFHDVSIQDDTNYSYYGPMFSTPLPSTSHIDHSASVIRSTNTSVPCFSDDAITKDSITKDSAAVT